MKKKRKQLKMEFDVVLHMDI